MKLKNKLYKIIENSAFFQKRCEAIVARAERIKYEEGCMDGYRRCEENMAALMQICKRDAARGERMKMMQNMIEREEKAYADGMEHQKILAKMD